MVFILCAHEVPMSTVDCESFGSIVQFLQTVSWFSGKWGVESSNETVTKCLIYTENQGFWLWNSLIVGLGELARGRRRVISDFPTGLMVIMQTQLFLNKIDNQGRFFSRATKSEIWGDRVPIQQVGPQILGLASVWKWLIRVSTEI